MNEKMSTRGAVHLDLKCNKCSCCSNGCSNEISLCKYYDAPTFLRENPYIIHGYRPVLSIPSCLRSMFLWSNETLNIWSHLLGFLFFFLLMVHHLFISTTTSNDSAIGFFDKVILCLGLICFQICLLCSTSYHIFKCHSAQSYRKWLHVDFFGISLGLVGCFLPGFHLGFYCFETWYKFYTLVIIIIFFLIVCWHSCTKQKTTSNSIDYAAAADTECNQTPTKTTAGQSTAKLNRLKVTSDSIGRTNIDAAMTTTTNDWKTKDIVEMENKMELHDNSKCLVGPVLFYGGLSSFGVVPAFHWLHLTGGIDSSIAQTFMPKIGILYVLLILAFVFYVSKFPECCFPGRFDFIGSSHQCWHVLIVLAFFWWYLAGMELLEFIVKHKCSKFQEQY